jgi:polyvinyl alcohol dehydrogenase (cytochrome)
MLRMRASAATAGLLLACACAAHADPDAAPPPPGVCAESAGAVAVGTAQWNGWGRDLENSRYQPEPALRAADVPKLRFKWAYGLPEGSESGAPTLVDGRVFIANSAGRVVALDARSGCLYWSFEASHGIHAALVVGELAPATRVPGIAKAQGTAKRKSKIRGKRAPRDKTNAHIEIRKPPSAVFVGDDAGALYALDAATGRLLWRTQADADPEARITGSPALYKTRLYVPVRAHPASLVAVDIVTGGVVWRTVLTSGGADLELDSGPTLDTRHETAFLATGGSSSAAVQQSSNAVLAFDIDGGSLRWTRQLPPAGPAGGFSSAPILRTLPGGIRLLVVAQNDGVLYGLDPGEAGAIRWQSKPEPTATDIVLWGAAADHRSVFVDFAVPAPDGGGLAALAIATGKVRWVAPVPLPACGSSLPQCSHAQSQAVTVMPGVAFSGSQDGHLRAYSTIDGKIVWDFDTAQNFATTDRHTARGGALDRGGPVIVGGMVYVSSGNALLAFVADGK